MRLGTLARLAVCSLPALLLSAACGSESTPPATDSSPTDADGGTSTNPGTGPGTGAGCQDICIVGTKSCEGAGVATCVKAEGACATWSPIAACGAGELCSGGVCQKGCVNQCTDGAVQCSAVGNGVSVCSKQPSGCTDWAAPKPCAGAEVCSGGKCVAQCTNQCTVGIKQCSGLGNGVATCELKPSGCTDWGAPAACAANTACSGGQCVAQCANQCAAGAKQCSGIGNGVATCVVKPTGCTDWDTAVPCDGGKSCSGGACVAQCANQCTLGAEQCAGIGNGVAKCVQKPSGCTDWDTPVACVGGTTCSGGKCVAQCQNQCALGSKQCSGGGVSTCELRPSGCTDWGASIACAGGQVCAGGVCQGGGPVTWKLAPSPTNQRLTDVWGAGGSDVWAVGESGTILHYDGANWAPAASGTALDILGIWGSSATNIYAITGNVNGAELLRYDGAQWTKSVPFTTDIVGFTDIHGTGPNDVWIVGVKKVMAQYKEFVGHYDGNAWSQLGVDKAPNMGVYLRGVYTGAPGDVWIADALGNVAHLVGNAWTKYQPQSTSLHGSGTNDVWFATDNAKISHYDGANLVNVSSPYATGAYYGIFARTATDAWIVGASGRIIHSNGAAWGIDPRAAGVTNVGLYGVWANGPSDAWAVGASGTLVHLGP